MYKLLSSIAIVCFAFIIIGTSSAIISQDAGLSSEQSQDHKILKETTKLIAPGLKIDVAISVVQNIIRIMNSNYSSNPFGDSRSASNFFSDAASFLQIFIPPLSLIPSNKRTIKIHINNYLNMGFQPYKYYFKDGNFGNGFRHFPLKPLEANITYVQSLWPYELYGVEGILTYKSSKQNLYLTIYFICPLNGKNKQIAFYQRQNIIDIQQHLDNVAPNAISQDKQSQKIYPATYKAIKSVISSGNKVRMDVYLSNLLDLLPEYNSRGMGDRRFFIDPFYQQKVKSQGLLQYKQVMLNKPTAFWADSIASLGRLQQYLQSATKYQYDHQGESITAYVVVYNLPNRDCHATSSNGQLCCSGSVINAKTGECDQASYKQPTCSNGIRNYLQKYIYPMRQILMKYPKVQVRLILEPDSLPNLATNFDPSSKCGVSTYIGYMSGIIKAIETLSNIPNVQILMDAAHSGWLGWCGAKTCRLDQECDGRKCIDDVCECNPSDEHPAQKFVAILKAIFSQIDLIYYLRIKGFVSNIANYQPLGYPDDQDYCHYRTQYNFAHNQLRYIDMMDSLMKRNGIINQEWYIDTSRNGHPEIRSSPKACENWCNIMGKVGMPPSSNVEYVAQLLRSARLAGFLWVKPPGQSDGCASYLNDGTCPNKIDSMCVRDCNEGYQKCVSPPAGDPDRIMMNILTDITPPPQPVYKVVSKGHGVIISYHNTYLSADAKGQASLKSYNSGQQQWTFEHLKNANGEDFYSIRSVFGTYLSANDDGTVSLKLKRDTWEIWIQVTRKSFSYYKSKQWGSYLSAQKDGRLTLKAKADLWQQWVL